MAGVIYCYILLITDYYDYGPPDCSTSESITGGDVEYSDGGNDLSVLTYKCPPGSVPYPVSSRICSDGQWSKSASGNSVVAECKSNFEGGKGGKVEECVCDIVNEDWTCYWSAFYQRGL